MNVAFSIKVDLCAMFIFDNMSALPKFCLDHNKYHKIKKVPCNQHTRSYNMRKANNK